MQADVWKSPSVFVDEVWYLMISWMVDSEDGDGHT